MRNTLRSFIPRPLFSLYHLSLAYLSALIYRFPSEKLLVIAVTGTKGKSSTTECINAILQEAGYKTALINSIRFKIGDTSEQNILGRSTPGRFFIQRFLRSAVASGCTAAIIEMTSEGARQYRHRGIQFDALVFTNLAPEHIESHGSLEAYKNAKFELGKQLVRSDKRPRILVANADDPESARYLSLPVEKKLGFSLNANAPWSAGEAGGYFTFNGMKIETSLPGEFSLKNALAAATLAHALRIEALTIMRGLGKLQKIPGRAETIDLGQDFLVVVDYAHTPDSLEAICKTYSSRKKICIFGSAGGGRDTWKRPAMGKIADEYCEQIILTDDEAYDEDGDTIIKEIASGMQKKPEIIRDRRQAIREGLLKAKSGDAVLLIGMGVQATMIGSDGTKTRWSDVEVAREELAKYMKARAV